MAILLLGKLLLVTFMIIVMGAPLVAYMRRDARWESSKGRTVQDWYDRLK